MIRRLALASTALAVLTRPAAADPIFTPLLIAGLSSIGVTGAAATITATLASAVLVTAIGIGLTMLFAPKPPKPQNGSFAVQQPIPFRIYGYGTAKVPGAVMLKEESAGYLGFVAALNAHRISAFRSLYLNDDLVAVPIAGGLINGVAPAGADGRYKNGSVSMGSRRGLVPETAHGDVVQFFGSSWGSNFRGDGIASLKMICAPVKSKEYQTIYPYGAPQPAAVLDQALVYDPRDPTQDPNNDATWKFSDNPVLCLLHFRCFSPFGSAQPYATAILPALDRWIAAANHCDDQVALKSGGTEKRYRLGGWITTEQDRRTTMSTLLACCDGWTVDRGDGSIDIRVGKYDAPTVILTDDDIVAFNIQRDVATKDRVNRVTAKYVSPENAYTTVETDPIEDLADQALRPGPPRSSQMDLTWVQSTGQASRLQKRELIRQSEKTRGTLTLKLSGLNACFERWVLVQSNTIPRLSGVVIEIRKPVINLAALLITVDFIGSGPQIDAYNPATDESAPPFVAQRPATVGLPIPSNVSAIPEQNGTSVYLVVSWDLPLNNGNPNTSLSYQVQYRISAGSNGGVAGPWSPQAFDSPNIAGNRVSVATGVVPTGVVLDVQVSSIGTGASLSTGSDIVQADTALVAPAEPLNFTATPGTGQAFLSCGNPNSSVLASIQFYRTSGGSSFASSSPVGQPIPAKSGGTTTATDTVPAGPYTYFATAISSAGTASAPAGPVTITVV